MARPKNTFPVPFLRQRKSAWQLRWRYDDEDYGMSIGTTTKDEAKIVCAAIAVALAEKGEWPTEVLKMSAVRRYLAKKAGNEVHGDDKQLIHQYAQHLRLNSRSNWNMTVRSHLIAASNFTGNLLQAATPILSDFLNAIHETKSTATRNRALASLSGFYRWTRLRHILPKGHNPLEGIKILQEEHSTEGIVIWENDEIPHLMKAANTLKDGIAVWIAIYAGLRRGEIHRLPWEDVTPAYIIVRKSKTGIMRQVPLSQILADRLAKEPRHGPRVVPWSDSAHGWESSARRVIYEKLPTKLKTIHNAHPEKFGWNPFRHTFASRHAQAGTPIDVIAAWLGDSPKVCRKHYARYVPATMRDTRIDIVDAQTEKLQQKRLTKVKPKNE